MPFPVFLRTSCIPASFWIFKEPSGCSAFPEGNLRSEIGNQRAETRKRRKTGQNGLKIAKNDRKSRKMVAREAFWA